MNQTESSTDPGEVALRGTARSWFRRVRLRTWIVLSVILLVVVTPLLYRQYRVSQIPLIPEPFDVQKYVERYHIPNSENAYVEYREAVSKLVAEQKWNDALHSRNISGFEWGKAPVEVKEAVQANDATLKVWVKGAEKPRAVYVPPDQLKFDTQLNLPQYIRAIVRVAIWKQVQLQDERQLDDSWKIIDAGQRTSVHLMQGTMMIERLVGVAVHAMFSPHLSRWSEDPDVTVQQLRSALENLRDRQQSVPPISDMIKSEYFLFRSPSSELWDGMKFSPGDTSRISLQARFIQFVQWPLIEFSYRLSGEYEFSRRYLRQLSANWIKSVDLPPHERRARESTSGSFLIFQHQDQSEGYLSSDKLGELGQRTIIAKVLVPATEAFLSVCDRDRFRWSAEELILALQIYHRIHGEFPKDLNLLVPEVLEKLPENPYGDAVDAAIHYRVESDHVVIWSKGEYEPVPLESGPEYSTFMNDRVHPNVIYFTIYPPGTRAPLYRPYPPGFEEELKKREEAKSTEAP